MIDFTRESYNALISGEYDADELYGGGHIGAVCIEIVFHQDKLLDVNFYLLGKDDGYGDVNGIPYSYEDGFYATVLDTYEETFAKLESDINEYIANNKDLATGANDRELTWEKVEREAV